MPKPKTPEDDASVLISNHIVSFLKEWDLISVNRLNEKLGLPNSTIRKAMEGRRNIPPHFFYAIGMELSKYGFYWPENEENN